MLDTKAIIFDLDGVLVDTVELHFRSWKFLADQHGIPFSWEDMADFRGRRRRDCLLSLFDPQALTETEIHTYLAVKNGHYLKLLDQAAPDDLLVAHTRQLIETARSYGLKLGVASSSANAIRVLLHVNLFDLVDIVADGQTVLRSKPHSDIFLWTAGALRVMPAQCVVFEDSQAGVTAARNGGMYVVGVGQAAQVHQAHLVLSSLGAMPLLEILDLAHLHSQFHSHPDSMIKES